VQTFLPASDYEYSAQALDNKRLNKQVLEGYQILKILSGASETGAWRNHPAVLMWKGAEQSLMDYIDHMVYEAEWRGIKTDKNVANLRALKRSYSHNWGKLQPVWSKPEHIKRVITTHRANLYRKDPIIYASFASDKESEFNNPCCDKCLYYWATHKERNVQK
jgi:hypothetical protein